MDIDRDVEVMERQMQEFKKSIGISTNIVQTVIPSDSDLPPAKFACDHHFHLAEAYLVGNQARLAIKRFKEAMNAYDGNSSYEFFDVAVRLGLAESYAAVDVKEWTQALKYLDDILTKYPDEDRALAIKARVYVRQRELTDAYKSAIAALKSNSYNFEAACYLGYLGFNFSMNKKDTKEMKKDIENLKIAQTLYSSSKDLADLIHQCENILKNIKG